MLSSSKINSQNQVLEPNFHIGIITALPHEAAAVRAVFKDEGVLPQHNVNCGITFRALSSTIASKKKDNHQIVMCQTTRMGNNSSAVAATALLLQYPSIKNIIMTGIAGGVPNIPKTPKGSDEDHIRLGDVVVSHSVMQYDMIKRTIAKDENRDFGNPPSALLANAVNELKQGVLLKKYPWEKYLRILSKRKNSNWKRPPTNKDILFDFELDDEGNVISRERISHPKQTRRKGMPKFHEGKIGSANILLKDHRVRNELRTEYGIKAVEMEGSGIADASWNLGTGYIIVRGICDYCDPEKNDDWQNYASAVAASFTRAIIDQVPQLKE